MAFTFKIRRALLSAPEYRSRTNNPHLTFPRPLAAILRSSRLRHRSPDLLHLLPQHTLRLQSRLYRVPIHITPPDCRRIRHPHRHTYFPKIPPGQNTPEIPAQDIPRLPLRPRSRPIPLPELHTKLRQARPLRPAANPLVGALSRPGSSSSFLYGGERIPTSTRSR